MNQEANQLESQELKTFLDDTFDTMDKVLDDQNPELRQYEIGTVKFCWTRYWPESAACRIFARRN